MTKLFAARLEVVAAPLENQAALARAAGTSIVAIGVPVLESDTGPVLADGIPAAAPALARPVVLDPELSARQDFSGKTGQVMVVLSSSGMPAMVYLGCGKSQVLGTDELRRAAGALVRAAGRSGAAVMVLPGRLAEQAARPCTGRTSGDSASGSARAPSGSSAEATDDQEGHTVHNPTQDTSVEGSGTVLAHRCAAQAVTEGAVLAAYRFSFHKSEPQRSRVERFVVAGAGLDHRALEEGVARGARVAEAVCAARDLVNEPPSSMTPRRLAEAAGELVCTAATASAVTLEVWDEDRIAAERLGGLLGVARGSVEPPRLLRMGYEPADPLRVDGHVPHVVLVGKGITFDSGGLSLKSADGMLTMKTDMSGAATVLATVSACADLGVRVRVTAIVPVTENMPGGSAIKPGDVLIARDGQTIEVLNTDAEGRLVLADGLSLAVELHPDAIVDLATLTGAAVVALGRSIAALFGNDRALVDRVKEAAGRAGEPVWQLPLAREYRSHIESDVADMKNIGKAEQAGSIAAALLLERFVGGIPWVHIDMAGPARSDEDNEVFTKGGTGFGVRTLLELLEAYGDASSG